MSEASNPKAFPCGVNNPIQQGMTLRDWFAGQALTGILASMSKESYNASVAGGDWSCETGAAYRIAETMLKMRKATGL